MVILIVHSDQGKALAGQLTGAGLEAEVIRSPKNYQEWWKTGNALIFIGSLGICVRAIAPLLSGKKTDPAVVNIDAGGRFVQPVVSGHLGGANKLALKLAGTLGATPVITTVSDTSGLWSLDLLAGRFNWKMECHGPLNHLTAAFVNGQKTALLLEARDPGTLFLETTLPGHVDVFTDARDLDPAAYSLVLAVTPFIHDLGTKAVFYRPGVMHLGVGCRRGLPFGDFEQQLSRSLEEHRISPLAVCSLGTIDLKKDEKALLQLAEKWGIPFYHFSGEILNRYAVPNPSSKVEKVTGSAGVAEAAAMHLSGNCLLIGKTRLKAGERCFTYAAAFDTQHERKGFVEFTGAGPGDPELVSVRGKRLLQTADYILYAGSLVPEELTHDAKPGCVVESSAGMDLQTQLDRMKRYYDRGLFIVRLHTGDPCIYGAVQEQMAIMDQWGWHYHITPGISSFQAAAAALRSQFTIPGEVQTIILTRGEGRTPIPEREQLSKLAQSQSTMCIYLSASVAGQVQQELLTHYPPETPVAVCYKLSWKDEKIFRCTLSELAQTVEANKLSMTTLIVVGKAIDNRSGQSKLYHSGFEHAFRRNDQSC